MSGSHECELFNGNLGTTVKPKNPNRENGGFYRKCGNFVLSGKKLT